MNTYKIYCHLNKINNKAYIGQTCQDLKRRWREGEGYKNCSYFYAAIKKYGWNNFKHNLLLENLTLEQANYYEQLFIQLFKTNEPEFGYNLESGGLNKKHSKETKQKISNSLKGKMAGEKNPMFGKTTKIAKKVKCINTEEIFVSINKAHEKYNVDCSAIVKVCKGKRKSAGIHPDTKEPLKWTYINEDEI